MEEKGMYDDVLFNTFLDWRKKEIDRFTRAKMVKSYMERKKVSERELAREVGVSPSTISDWLLYNNITESEYETMKGNGLNDTEICKVLKNSKHKLKHDFVKITKFDLMVEEMIGQLKPYVSSIEKHDVSSATEDMLLQLKDCINRICMRIDRFNNGKE